MEDLLAAAEQLARTCSERSDEIEKARRLPADLSMQLAEAGIYAMGAPAALGGVEAPPAIYSQVIETLARNGANRASDVVLRAGRIDKKIRIEVADNGPGFDESVLPFVFDRFRRGDSLGSSGLGMAIAKKIVEAHGGSIAAANGPEHGALVTIDLPPSSD